MGPSLPPPDGFPHPSGRWFGAQWWARWIFKWIFKPMHPAEPRCVVELVAERRGVVELVGDCLRPPKRDRRRPLPIVLLWNPRGSRWGGGSYDGREPDERLGPSMLDHLAECFSDGRPYVHRNGDELDKRRPHKVAELLASHLSCRVEGFGRLKFPRLLLGLAATGGAAVDIEGIMAGRRRLIGLLREIVPYVQRIPGAPPVTGFVLGLAVKALVEFFGVLVPLSVRRGLRWYRYRLGKHLPDPFDTLKRLKECEGQTPVKVDEVLCRAFLADLRDGYSTRSIRLFKRDENCLALLNDTNWDTTWKSVRGFLDVLAAQRQGWDPLLIVVVASPRSLLVGRRHPEGLEFRKAMEATYQDWSSNRKIKKGWEHYYPLCLDDSCPKCDSDSGSSRGRS